MHVKISSIAKALFIKKKSICSLFSDCCCLFRLGDFYCSLLQVTIFSLCFLPSDVEPIIDFWKVLFFTFLISNISIYCFFLCSVSLPKLFHCWDFLFPLVSHMFITVGVFCDSPSNSLRENCNISVISVLLCMDCLFPLSLRSSWFLGGQMTFNWNGKNDRLVSLLGLQWYIPLWTGRGVPYSCSRPGFHWHRQDGCSSLLLL